MILRQAEKARAWQVGAFDIGLRSELLVISAVEAETAVLIAHAA